MAEIGGKQLSTLLESLPGIASVLRSPVADAIVNLVRAAAGVDDFRESDAKELVQYATRRGLLGADEGADLLAEIKGRGKKGGARARAKPAKPKPAKPSKPTRAAPAVKKSEPAKPAATSRPAKTAKKKTAAKKKTTSAAKPKARKAARSGTKKKAVKKTAKKPVRKTPAKKKKSSKRRR